MSEYRFWMSGVGKDSRSITDCLNSIRSETQMTDAEKAAEEYAYHYKKLIQDHLIDSQRYAFPAIAWDKHDFKVVFLAGVSWARANPEQKRTWLEECERLEAEQKLKMATIGKEPAE